MTPQARTQAIIELLELTLEQPFNPCDKIFHFYCKQRRYIGSKDRKEIAKLFYAVLRIITRYKNQTTLIEHLEAYDLSRILVACCLRDDHLKGLISFEDLDDLFTNATYAPEALTKQEKKLIEEVMSSAQQKSSLIPSDLLPLFTERFNEQERQQFEESLTKEASVDLRVNTLKTSKKQAIADLMAQGINATETPFSPIGIRLSKRTSLDQCTLLKDGQIEVQDEGSQLLGLLCDAEPSMTVLDYCAGAGGKTLTLAAQMQNKGQIVASDISLERLQRAKLRLRRAGVCNVRFHEVTDVKFFKRHHNFFDRVLVDVPCSGTGTWRRNPDLKLKTSLETINNLTQTQRAILTATAPLVKPNGLLIYATCSVLLQENQKQIEWFLKQFNNFEIAMPNLENSPQLLNQLCEHVTFDTGLSFLTHTTQTDGFYVCILKKVSAH